MKILVTGFRPFLGEVINPSEILALELSKTCAVESCILPVEFSEAYRHLDRYIQQAHYDYILMLGQAAGREAICFEKIALNWIQTDSADEAGHLPSSGPVLAERPLALMSPFPIDQIYQKLKAENQPVKISFSAGTYVCNEIYYKMLDSHSAMNPVFIHVPLIREQVNSHQIRPFLDKDRQLDIMKKIISELRLGR